MNMLRKLLFSIRCSYCGKEIEKGYFCDKCKKKILQMSELKKRKEIYYLFYYNDFKNIIFDFKFKNRKGISIFLKECIETPLKRVIKDENIDIVIPVPISDERKIERGFNQVEEVLKECGIIYCSIKRVKKTKYMNRIKTMEERKRNIENSFEIKDDKFSGKNILIVDDIITTGTTLNELKKNIYKKNRDIKIVFFSFSVVKKYFKE